MDAPASSEAPQGVPTASSVTDTEEGRAFFQRRLALMGLTMCALAGGSWALLALVYLLESWQGRPVGYHPLREGGPYHLSVGLMTGALWLATRKDRRSGALLNTLDIAATTVMQTALTLGAASNSDPLIGEFVALLCFHTGMLGRAIVVPSTARRTLLLGLVCGVPVIGIAALHGASRSEGALSAAVSAGTWTASAIVLASVASLTIFRLRSEVQQARVLGQYTLEAKIGEGGMGEVWRASHVLLKRPTAIKLLPPGRTRESAIQRFEREVKLTARLRHPSTVAIYDYGRTRDGVFYYAMELLDGMNLEVLVNQHGPQPPGRVVHVLSQVCGALAEAHDLGLVHRDIKPANVLLLPKRGEPELAKVVDFGLVKDLQDVGGPQPGLTAANTITGTPLYMAPEAIQNPESIDAASDLYALGAVGWFLLVGRPVFDGANIIEVCSKHLHEPPLRPSEALRAPIAADLEDIVLSCLEKKPARRPRDARELRRRLHACSVASDWTEEQAAQWWRDHEQNAAPMGRGTGSRTIALEIAARAAVGALLWLGACGSGAQPSQETDAAGSNDGGSQDAAAQLDHTSGSTDGGGSAGDAADSGDGAPRDGADAEGGKGGGTSGDAGDGGGTASDGGWPTPTAICGTSMLTGPSSAPAGAITLSPGASTIQDAIAAHSAGNTTYYLTAGTYAVSGPINPNDNDTFIGAPGAIIDGSSSQQVAFGLNDHASGVTIQYLTIQHFVGPQNNGVVNQGQGANWTIRYNTIRDNTDQNGGANGIEVGDNNVVSYNCITGNAQTGISSVGNTGFVVDHNEVSSNGVGYEAKHSCGCSGGMKFFTSTKGTVTDNWIHGNGSVGLWLDTNNSFFLIRGNVVEKNENEGIMYEISYNGVIENNVIQFNGIAGNAGASDFPEPSIYVSESGGYDSGAAVMLSGVDVNGVLRIANNLFYDNADGVTLYQNGLRCCGSQDGCSTSCSPLPLYMEVDAHGNQRWNTQNVTVSNNTFTNDSDAGCTTQASQHNYCTVTGLFSTAMTIDQAIAFQQNNVFENNTYAGPWQFLCPDQGSSLSSPATWQAAPFNQDHGSVFH